MVVPMEVNRQAMAIMKIAIEGCAHGELEKIYETIAHLEAQNNYKIDLLICCGDFQASRNYGDVECMAVPPKYRQLCSFYKYYSGEKAAPILTIVIGGNHEASNHFQELAYGGWLAPNVYYLGYAGLVQVGGIRIAGLSGIFKARDFHKGRYEIAPYSEDTKRSCYHTRTLDVFRLKQVQQSVDVMLSHDWPEGIYRHGDVRALLRQKPFFEEDINNGRLGSPPCAELLQTMQPRYWFAAHLHVKFPALVQHEKGTETKFLALDKCLPRRQFLQVLDVPHKGDIELKYDEEWCAILRSTDHLTSVSSSSSYMPGPGHTQRWDFRATEDEKEEVRKRLDGDLKVPQNFVQTAPPHDPSSPNQRPWCALNPQTTALCQKLGIDDPLSLLLQQTPKRSSHNTSNSSRHNYSSFQLSGDESLEMSFGTPVSHRRPYNSSTSTKPHSPDSSQLSCFSMPSPRSPLNLVSSASTETSSSQGSQPRTPLNLPPPKSDDSLYGSQLSWCSQPSPRTALSLPTPKLFTDDDIPSPDSPPFSSPLNVATTTGLLAPVSSTPKRDSIGVQPAVVTADSSETENVSYSIDAQPSAISEDASMPSGPKKFRRRNVALYSLTKEGDT